MSMNRNLNMMSLGTESARSLTGSHRRCPVPVDSRHGPLLVTNGKNHLPHIGSASLPAACSLTRAGRRCPGGRGGSAGSDSG